MKPTPHHGYELALWPPRTMPQRSWSIGHLLIGTNKAGLQSSGHHSRRQMAMNTPWLQPQPSCKLACGCCRQSVVTGWPRQPYYYFHVKRQLRVRMVSSWSNKQFQTSYTCSFNYYDSQGAIIWQQWKQGARPFVLPMATWQSLTAWKA